MILMLCMVLAFVVSVGNLVGPPAGRSAGWPATETAAATEAATAAETVGRTATTRLGWLIAAVLSGAGVLYLVAGSFSAGLFDGLFCDTAGVSGSSPASAGDFPLTARCSALPQTEAVLGWADPAIVALVIGFAGSVAAIAVRLGRRPERVASPVRPPR